MYDIQVVVRGVSSADEDRIEGLQRKLEELGARDPAVVFWPLDEEIGMCFQIEEELLGQLFEPSSDRAAA